MKADTTYHTFAFEQKALHDLITSDWNGARSCVAIRPTAEFNSVYADAVVQGKRDGFVVHLMASDAASRKAAFLDIAARLGVR